MLAPEAMLLVPEQVRVPEVVQVVGPEALRPVPALEPVLASASPPAQVVALRSPSPLASWQASAVPETRCPGAAVAPGAPPGAVVEPGGTLPSAGNGGSTAWDSVSAP